MEKRNDLKGNKGKFHKEALRAWHHMHDRVAHDKNYADVNICDEWYLYSNFYFWYSDNYVPGWDLDKDIKGGSQYSPDNCVIVPHEINQLFRNVNTRYGRGVVKNGKGYQAQITIGGQNIKLGTFPTIEMAREVYEIARKKRLDELKVLYPVLSDIL